MLNDTLNRNRFKNYVFCSMHSKRDLYVKMWITDALLILSAGPFSELRDPTNLLGY